MARRFVQSLRDDTWLESFLPALDARRDFAAQVEQRLTGGKMSLADFASGHEYFGLHREADGSWIFREWAPNATSMFLLGTFSGWRTEGKYRVELTDGEKGLWELRLPADAMAHGDLYRLRMEWNGGHGERLPAWTRRVIQDDETKIFNAQVWEPDSPWQWKNKPPVTDAAPLIYEAHVGIAQEHGGTGTYAEFRELTLPRIVEAGYNTVQLMAVMEHPYYGSFGYHVANFFAASSRFGTPDELKELVDAIHGAGLRVIMDLVHSHSVRNEAEGLADFDGTRYQYFHEGARGYHKAWDSLCFDYAKPEVLHFLLSNCRYWLDEYHFDGYRVDGVTSMLYHHHGLGEAFTQYSMYFDHNVDDDAMAYLALANKVIHSVRPDAITVAEDVSGMPGLGAELEDGGCGFDYRLAMGVPDFWFKIVKETRDEDWNVDTIWHELTNRRQDEQVISYVESHDQAIVGGKSFIFELVDEAMYHSMAVGAESLAVDRGLSIWKLARLITMAAAPHGYLSFIGNEFGHPEWVDFPREGNNWSHHYARRQWSLRDNRELRYSQLGDFDKAIMHLAGDEGIYESVPEKLHTHIDDQVLAFRRGDLFFVFNFSPGNSYADYPIGLPAGSYELVLDTDAAAFAGHGRLDAGQVYESPVFYLPTRTALVLKKKSSSKSGH